MEEGMKVCSACGIEKMLCEFPKDKRRKCGYSLECEKCHKERLTERRNKYYQENKDLVLGINKKSREKNKEIIRERKKLYRAKNKEKIAEHKKKYAEENKEKIAEYHRNYNKTNFDRIAKDKKKYAEENKDKVSEYQNNYRKVKNEEINKQRLEYRQENKELIAERDKAYKESIAKYETYKDQLTIEEDAIEGENGVLLCLCSYCKEYHPVTNRNAHNRAQSIKGWGGGGESRLYCSEKCKDDCDIYYAKLIPKSLRSVTNQARCNQNRVRQILLDIQFDEEGYNWCEKCGDVFKPEDLFFHHNIPIGDDPTEYDNAAHYMLVCKDHHEHKGCLGNKYE